MSSRKVPEPTDAELAILCVLWEEGSATVRQVHERLGPARGTGYTTTLKLMQMMAEKGLVRRDVSQRSHVYSAAVDQHQTQRRLVRRLLDQAFSGSAAKLVMQALAAKRHSAGELRELRELIDARLQDHHERPARKRKG